MFQRIHSILSFEIAVFTNMCDAYWMHNMRTDVIYC